MSSDELKIETNLQDLKIGPEISFNEEIDRLYADLDKFSISDINNLLDKAHETNQIAHLKEKFQQEPSKTIQIIQKSSNTKLFLSTVTTETSLKYIKLLKEHIKKLNVDKKDLETSIDLADRLINHFKYEIDDITALISVLVPHIAESDIVSLIIIKFYTQFKEKSYTVLEDQFEIATVESKYVVSFKLLSLIFHLNPVYGSKLFELQSLQTLLSSVDARTKSNVIKEGLLLLSSACVDDELRKKISERFLGYLTTAVKYADLEIRTLSALVIVKTWNFISLTENRAIDLDDIVGIFLEQLNEYSIEGLAYLTIKTSVKIKLRKDSEFIFDLMSQLRDPLNGNHYGILVILANLSTIEEKTEMSELKKQAQKGLEGEIEEDETEVEEFKEDLLERTVVSTITQLKHLSRIALHQVILILNNLSNKKKLNTEIIKQGGLHILLKVLEKEEPSSEYRWIALRALSSLLITSDPQLVFNNDSPKTALNYLFEILPLDEVKEQDKFQGLLALTNLSILDNGPLTESQWEVIDSVLSQDNALLRRSAIELVSNLMQHKSGLSYLFNFDKPSSRKRSELIIQYTLLEDVKSQSSAISALAFGVTIPFIAEELLKSESLLSNLIAVIEEQSSEEELVERALFVLYHLVFYGEDSGIPEKLRKSQKLKTGISKVVRTVRDKETKDMALEIASLVKFK